MEYADDRTTSDTLFLDGKERVSEMFNAPRVTKTSWSAKMDSLIVESKVTFDRGGQKSEMTVNESWTLREQGNVLSIHQVSDSFFGKRDVTMVFDKKFPH
jgi:hypothetical protein